VDANQRNIVEGLRQFGVSVRSTAQLGGGFPDICCGYKGKTYLLEIKDSEKTKFAKKLTPDEALFLEKWRGQVAVVECLNDALSVLGVRV
jgi:Holliday junction resolvase